MTSNKDVADAFANGKRRTARNMFSEGDVVYSYGHHFPIARRLDNGDIIFNPNKYSVSTTHHQSLVLSAISKPNQFSQKKIYEIFGCQLDHLSEQIERHSEELNKLKDSLKRARTRKDNIIFRMQELLQKIKDLLELAEKHDIKVQIDYNLLEDDIKTLLTAHTI